VFPIFFQLGGFTFHSYGLFTAVGFLLGIGLAVKEARRKGIPIEKILDLSFYVILSAILGARLLYVLINYQHYLEHPLDFFKIW
jgi:phosphatidylglycerol:prolipoprotein diacylglycerol transferase